MVDDLTIREMTEEDRADWLACYAQLFPDGTQSGMNREIDRILAAENRVAYCAEKGHRLLGFAEYSIRDFANGCISQPVPFLEGIWVAEEARRSGVAKALVAHVERVARTQGYNELGSDVDFANDKGLALHHALGFEETERVVYFRKAL